MALQRILIVDTSPAMRETAVMVLADGYDVTAVSDEEFFDRRVQYQNAFDLLILGASELLQSSVQLLPQEVPILWLAGSPGWSPPNTGGPYRRISRAFVPLELRQEVQQLLQQARRRPYPFRSPARLEYPFLSTAAAAVARQAVATQLPVLICGTREIGRSALARHIHQLGRGGAFVSVTGGSFVPADLPVPGETVEGTLFLDQIERLDAEAQLRLLGLMESNGLIASNRLRARLVAGSEMHADELLAHLGFSIELYYRIAVLIIEPIALRDRPQDVPALARRISEDLAPRLSLAPVSFTDAALERLSNHLWFGDIAELEGVLARTLTMARRETIDVADLCFDVGRQRPPSPKAAPGLTRSPQAQSSASGTLQLLINEIAHELKNPMVSVKTFAQHLRRMGFRGADEEQVAKLAGEAIDQMDQIVENLVQFTHFSEPIRERVSLASILGPALANVAQLIKPRARRIDYRPSAEQTIFVDRSQVSFALTNLFRALARGLGDTGRMTVGTYESGRIVVELPIGYDSSDAHLAALLTTDGPPAPPLSLPAALATQIIERNGGTVTFDTQGQPPKVTVQLPVADDEEVSLAHHAQTPRSNR